MNPLGQQDDLTAIVQTREEASWESGAWVSMADAQAWWRKAINENPDVRIMIIEEGDYPSEFPDGAVIVEATEGDRMLAVAVLPLRLRDLPVWLIVQALWPGTRIKRILPRTRFGD